jgi:glycosyltransferase involved in cell wall biosynthesis
MVQYATPNASFYASRAAKSAKVPVRVYCQWGIRYVGFSGIKRMIFKFLEKCVCKKSTHVFAVSPKNMQFAINEGLYKKDKAQVIGNGGTIGVNMREFDIDKKTFWCKEIRKTYGINDKDLVFGFVGRISSDKGVYELLGAFRDVSNENPNAKLMVVGPSDDNDEKLVDLLDWAKSSNKVIFTGGIENSKIKEYYSAMDVLVHPTYREGFGMVIQEAGALAVPVITTKIPGASEVMVDGQSCVLVEPKNTDELKNAMLSMTKEKADEIGKNTFDRTAKLYVRQIMLENQQKAYEKLLGE